MAWEVLATHTDPENGTTVVKQRRRRPKHGNEIRYLITTKSNRVFSFNRNELFDITDTVNDVCEMVEEGKF